jgi:D-sedoheptulose 7-phosphate isomerase
MTAPDTRGGSPAAAEIFARIVAELGRTLHELGEEHWRAVDALAADVLQAWRRGGKLLVCGNGGSAADSQHLAAELVGRYLQDRPGWPAVALTVNTSTLTAVANDYGYEAVFARQIEAVGGPDDVLLVISTSGNSPNCVTAARTARERGLRVHGFLGGDGGELRRCVDGALVVPSGSTPRIQEVHITMIHLLCEILEARRLGAAGASDD